MGALVGIASKPPQENVPWHKYQWILCVSYQKLNHVTHPFYFPIPFFNEMLHGIDTEAK